MKKPRILECTLRDGSYAINFQFTAEDTRLIARALEDVGFDMIEVGHGIGLGASENGKGYAAESDEKYLQVASDTIINADWGMFCIPGIATLDHVIMAAEHGMKFIRIGTNIEEYQQAKPFIELARKHGMYVCANFMKSYVCTAEEFANYALEAEKFGADVVYLVDSAGGMFPEEIAHYAKVLRDKTSTLTIGYHGHNNLGMSVASSLAATEAGIEIIDTSLQGFGRGGGNTPTEQFLCAMIRSGIDMNIDPVAVMDIGEKYIQPLITTPGLSSLDLVAGLAFFHSSYLDTIEQYAKKYRVDPRRLIIAVCKKDKTNAPTALVEEEAAKLAKQSVHGSWKPLYKHYYGGEQS